MSCVSGNVEVRIFIAKDIETQEHKYPYLCFKIAVLTMQGTYIYGKFMWVLLLSEEIDSKDFDGYLYSGVYGRLLHRLHGLI